MLHLKLTVPAPLYSERVRVRVNHEPGDNYPAEHVDGLKPGNVLVSAWGERGVCHLVLVPGDGHGVSLEMSGPAALALAGTLADAAREVWAAARHLAGEGAPVQTAPVALDRCDDVPEEALSEREG